VNNQIWMCVSGKSLRNNVCRQLWWSFLCW